jgi:acyl carrier protein|tara:strand:- start:677 stop:904 length:228 start_codon:yes stop_codon:yes gene_type:complete
MDKNKKIKTIETISRIIKVDLQLINESSCMDDFSKWDSLAHLSIMLELEKKFKKKVNTSKMIDLNSVNKILKFFN